MTKKQKKIFKIIIIVLLVVLAVELVYFGIKLYTGRKNSVFYDVTNSAIIDNENNYIGVGFSDYRHSDFNDYKDGYNKATIYKKENGKVVKEVGLKKGYNSFYYDVVETEDGYIAVGAIEMTKTHNEDKLSEGLIVKYDKNLKQVWRKNIAGIGKTTFVKVKLDKKNNIIVVGESIYGQGYIGNHTEGGAILFKFDKDGNELLKINKGGPYSGKYNDFLIEDDGYVAVGLGRNNSGIIVKYNKKGKEVWNNSYGYTNNDGITGIDKINDKYVVSATKLVDKEDTSNGAAAIILFDKKGKKIDSVKYTSDKVTAFNNIKVIDDSIYACGYTKNDKDNSQNAVIVKYDEDLFEEESNTLKGNKNDYYKTIYKKNNKLLVLSTSNSKLKEYKVNGYDYSSFIKIYTKDLK